MVETRAQGVDSWGIIFAASELFCHNESLISEEEDMADLSSQCIDCGVPLNPEVEESCCRCVWCESVLVRGHVSTSKLDEGTKANLNLVPNVTNGEFLRRNAKFFG